MKLPSANGLRGSEVRAALLDGLIDKRGSGETTDSYSRVSHEKTAMLSKFPLSKCSHNNKFISRMLEKLLNSSEKSAKKKNPAQELH